MPTASMIFCCAWAISAPEELRLRCQDAEVFARGRDSQAIAASAAAGGCGRAALRRRGIRFAVSRRARRCLARTISPPHGWQPHPEPLLELLSRYARTHGPFTLDDLWRRYRLRRPLRKLRLAELLRKGRLLEGGFRPGGVHREWVHPEVLQQLRRRTLARLRREVEPLEHACWGCFCRAGRAWAASARRAGDRALLDAIETLARRSAAALRVGARDSARAHQGLRSRRSGYADGRRRGGVGRTRSAGRARWTPGPVPGR